MWFGIFFFTYNGLIIITNIALFFYDSLRLNVLCVLLVLMIVCLFLKFVYTFHNT